MAVAFDAIGPGATGVTSNSAPSFAVPVTWSHTCTGANGCLVVGLTVGPDGGQDTTAWSPSVTYNSVALTKAGRVYSNATTGAGFVELWYLLSPATGANTASFSMTGQTNAQVNVAIMGSVSYTGVASVGTAVTASGSSSPSVAVSSASGNMAVAMFGVGAATGAANQTQRWHYDSSPTSGVSNALQQDAAGAGTVTFTTATSDWFGAVALNLVAAGGGVTTIPELVMAQIRR